MVICKKAQPEDLEVLTFAIIRMNAKFDCKTGSIIASSNKTITKSEISEYMNHMYYLYDTELNTIVAVICGCRCDRTENINDPMNSVMISMKRYEIKYFVHQLCDEESLINLVREFLADMNDFPTIYKTKVTNEDTKKALRANNFVYNDYLKIFIRLPIANTSVIW